MSLLKPAALIAGAVLAVSAACSANSESDDDGASGSGANAPGTGSGGGLTVGSAQGGNHTGGGCAGDNYSAEEQPLDMYIMLDQSGSMSETVQSGSKWTAVTGALGQFVQLPDAAGIGVGLQYFPISSGPMCPLTCNSDPDCGPCGPCLITVPQFPGFCLNAGGDSCNVVDYATPEVPIAELPGVAGAIQSSMAAHTPSGNTPTAVALEGAIAYATSHGQANPNHVVIVVLATDGEPTSCDNNLPNIPHLEAIAAAGVNGSPSILSFVIGVGNVQNLDAIAAAGGTQSAFIVDTNQNVTQQFLDALNAIKGAALGCAYSIPVPTMGDPDYGSVNVEYTSGGGDTILIPKVPSAADCPANGDGWYYDDNAAPTKILLCDGTCAKIAADDKAQVEIVLGCESVIE
jgi:hypothetical protein